MKLYYAPGACSLASHIIMREAGCAFDLVRIDLATGKMADGDAFSDINPKGYVPALQLDDGQVLTENQVILQYLADQTPEARLVPPAGTMARYRVMEWLAFIATELHKSFGPLWNPQTPEATRQNARALLAKRFGFVEAALSKQDWLSGDRFGIADAYLFTVMSWTRIHHIDLTPWPHLLAYQDRIAARPAVQSALRAEGLIQ